MRTHLFLGAALASIVAHQASAQTTAAPATSPAATIAERADGLPNNPDSGDVIVTGSRVDRQGYEAPTPVTVLGPDDIRQGDRASIAQLLNDQPAFRATLVPVATPANTNSGSAAADLRGLGTARTLTLLNSRRFVGSGDLNSVPIDVIKRVEVVTGGASADWGSGAVAGVVNIILDDSLRGLRLAADAGVATRGDAARANLRAAYGTGFAGHHGTFIVAGGYFKDEGSFARNDGSRPNVDSTIFTSTTGQLSLQNNVNLLNSTTGGLIRTGPLAGQAFNPDGTLSPITPGSLSNATQTVGGSTRNVTDFYALTPPYKRLNGYARATYEVSPAAKLWVDANFNRMEARFPFFPENVALTIQSTNAYLSPAVRTALGATTSFTLGRLFADVGPLQSFSFAYRRDTLDLGAGLGGSLGGSWRYDIYYDHGRITDNERPSNQRITANFTNAIDSVISPTTGQPICRIALTTPTTTCVPINPLGAGNISAGAVAYAFGTAEQTYVTQLDAGGATLRGNLFSTWAGPVSIAFGVEGRREGFKSIYIDPISPTRAFSLDNRSPISGSLTVKEAFAEAVVPVINAPGTAVLELNGAGRYSDYSTSGGIWTWKGGATLQLVDDLRFRGVYSRDIRSPPITALYAVQSINIPTIVDPFRNNASYTVTRYTGGNPNLLPETANTLSFGGSYSPRWARGLNLSVDYYAIDIDNVIGTISAQDAINRCYAGYQPACATIVRDASGLITTLFGTQVNLAAYKTRGIDFDLGYRMPLTSLGSTLPGAIRLRLLATHVSRLQINDGVNTYDRAGDVGDNASFTTPKWKATGTIGYESDGLSFDTRVRYVGGGLFNHLQAITNNRISSRTYVDFNAQYRTGGFTIYGSVVNAFDRDPPYVTFASAIYDVIGTYVSGGVKLAL